MGEWKVDLELLGRCKGVCIPSVAIARSLLLVLAWGSRKVQGIILCPAHVIRTCTYYFSCDLGSAWLRFLDILCQFEWEKGMTNQSLMQIRYIGTIYSSKLATECLKLTSRRCNTRHMPRADKFGRADEEESRRRRYTREQSFGREVKRDNAILREESVLRD